MSDAGGDGAGDCPPGRRRRRRRGGVGGGASCCSSSAARRPPRRGARGRDPGGARGPGASARCSSPRPEGEIVGVLSASWQRALHVPGRYATIQDLWVDPEWRSRRVGAALVDELVALCGKQGVARIEVGLPRESFDAIRATEAFYRRQRVRAARPTDAAAAAVSELLMVEQRRGSDDAAHWIREGGRTMPGRDSNLRLDELRAGLVRHARVRAVAADAGDEALERTLGAMHEPAYLEALRRVNGDAGGDGGASPRPGSSPTSRSTPASSPPPTRACARRSPRPSGSPPAPASPTPSAARPATTPAPTSSAATATSTTPPRRCGRWPRRACGRSAILDLDLHYPNGTAALVERMEDATLHSLHASPVTNVAAGTRAAAGRGRTGARLRRGRPTPTPTWSEVARLDRRRSPPTPPPWSSRSATTPSPATRTAPGASSRRSSPRSAACWPRSGVPVCVIQEGGYSLPALAACSHAFATGLLGEEPAMSARAGAVPPPPRRDRRRDRPPARRALRDLPRSRPLQERPRDPDDAARPGRGGARPLPRPRRRGRAAGRVHRRPLRSPDRRHLQGGGRADGRRGSRAR